MSKRTDAIIKRAWAGIDTGGRKVPIHHLDKTEEDLIAELREERDSLRHALEVLTNDSLELHSANEALRRQVDEARPKLKAGVIK